MTITVYIQGWKTNSRCSGKGDVTSFFFFKADISTLFGLKNEKKNRKKQKKQKTRTKIETKRSCQLLVAFCEIIFKIV